MRVSVARVQIGRLQIPEGGSPQHNQAQPGKSVYVVAVKVRYSSKGCLLDELRGPESDRRRGAQSVLRDSLPLIQVNDFHQAGLYPTRATGRESGKFFYERKGEIIGSRPEISATCL